MLVFIVFPPSCELTFHRPLTFAFVTPRIQHAHVIFLFIFALPGFVLLSLFGCCAPHFPRALIPAIAPFRSYQRSDAGSSVQSIHSMNRSMNDILDDLIDPDISEEPFDDSAGFRPAKNRKPKAKKIISDEPFDDSLGFRPIKKATAEDDADDDDKTPRTPSTSPQESVHDDGPGNRDSRRGESYAGEGEDDGSRPGIARDFPCDSNTMSRMLGTDFESVMDEMEEAVGTLRRIWGQQRDTQEIAYVRPDGVLVDHDGVELRKNLDCWTSHFMLCCSRIKIVVRLR